MRSNRSVIRRVKCNYEYKGASVGLVINLLPYSAEHFCWVYLLSNNTALPALSYYEFLIIAPVHCRNASEKQIANRAALLLRYAVPGFRRFRDSSLIAESNEFFPLLKWLCQSYSRKALQLT